MQTIFSELLDHYNRFVPEAVPEDESVSMENQKLMLTKYCEEQGWTNDLVYCDTDTVEHWTRIRTNNVIERLNREIRRRTRVERSFPDGNSALMLVCARLRHAAVTQWGNKKHMNMKHLEAALDDASLVG